MPPTSHKDGVARPENFRVDELGHPPKKTANTGPKKHPVTGRFVKGGPGGPGRRRTLKEHAGRLGALDPTTCEDWLRRWVVEARAHAADLVAELPYRTPELCAVATELAEARALRAALTSLGSQGDAGAREESRHWLRECRQHALCLRGLINQEAEARRTAAATPPARGVIGRTYHTSVSYEILGLPVPPELEEAPPGTVLEVPPVEVDEVPPPEPSTTVEPVTPAATVDEPTLAQPEPPMPEPPEPAQPEPPVDAPITIASTPLGDYGPAGAGETGHASDGAYAGVLIHSVVLPMLGRREPPR
jgi:hypothetical protein